MAKGHWQIFNHKKSGKSSSGDFETVPIYNVPKIVLKTAIRATSVIGNGLYGVDVKLIDDKCYIIEVNDNPNIDADTIEALITSKTKAIVPVHLFGRAANMDAIMEIANEYNLYVIEDNAQAIGADYTSKDGSKKKVGTIGHVGATSFFPSKNLGCYGDGGAIFTNDDALAHTLRGIANHGMYERYHHDVVGVNSRLDSIQAGVLKVKLPLLDSYNKARQEAARKYSLAIGINSNIVAPTICDSCDCHVFHQYVIRITNGKRDGLLDHLQSKGIPCAIYYPIPLHSQKAYADSRYKESDFPVTNQLCKEVIALPMHTELDEEQIQFITDSILEYLGDNR